MTWLRGLLIFVLLIPAVAWADNPMVGTTAAVNPDATGTPPGGESQTLLIGTNVVFKEKIKTVGKGQTQILFVDQSTVTVAPNSELVLDEFVYDPNASTGKLTITMGAGLLRYVGGVISHNSGVTINTPTATLTVRGGMVLVQADTSGTSVVPILGTTIIKPIAGGGAPLTPATGTLTTVSGGGQANTTQASGAQIQGLYTALQGPSNPSGGVTVGAVDQQLGTGGMAGGSQPASGSSPGTQTTGGTSGGTSNGTSNTGTGGTNTGAPPPSVQNSANNGTQSSAAQPGSSAVANAGPFGGRLLSTGSPYTTTFGDVFSDPAAQDAAGGPIGTPNNQGFSNAQISNGRLIINLTTPDNGQTLIDLPIQVGSFTVSGPTTTPANGSQVIGTGFYDPAIGFFYYNVVPANGTKGQGVLVGGTPTPNGGLLPGGSIPPFEAWNFQPDITTTIPTLPTSIASQFPNATVSPILGVFQPSGTIGVLDTNGVPDPNGNVRSHFLWAALDVVGQGGSQKSMLIGSAGGFFGDGGNLYLSQAERGTINLGGGSPPLRLLGNFGSVPGAGATATSSGPVFYGPDLNDFVVNNNDPGAGNGAFETDGVFISSQDFSTSLVNGFTALASKTTTPAGVGTNRSDHTLNGYFADLGQSFIPVGGAGYQTPYAITNANGLPTDLSLQTDIPTNTIFTKFNFGVPAGQSDVTSGQMTFGGFGFGRSAYIDDQHLGALNSIAQAGNLNGDAGQTNQFQTVDGYRAFMVSHDLVGTSGLLPAGVNLCTCEFLEWGYWTSQFIWDNAIPANVGRTEKFNIGTWVAGDLTSVAQVQGLTGSATFSGHAIANVFDGTNQYLAAGSFSSNWNFGTATGTVAINSLDNHNYTGNIATGGGAANNFSGTIASGTISGPLNGSFFNAPTVPAAYMGGSVTAKDSLSAYRLSGTFAAQRP